MHRVLLILLLTSLLQAAPPEELLATDGKAYAPLDSGGKKVIVLFFVSPFCSTTRPFMREINAISADYADRAATSLIHSDSEITIETAFQHAEMEEVRTRVLIDKEQHLARHLRASVTPEAFILSPKAEVLYQGRINDLYLGPTKRRRTATTKDLRDALDNILADKPVSAAQEPAQGCKIGGLK
jgi:hypothetical protein